MDKFLFAQRLREQRKLKKMTQQQLADLLMVNPATVNQWENAKRLPERKRFLDIARELGCSEYYLEGLTDSPNPENDEVKLVDEKAMVRMLLSLSEKGKRIALATITALSEGGF